MIALLLSEGITWIKVEPPQLDIVGIVLGSLGLAGAFAAIAVALGIVLGVTFIRRGRRQASISDGTLRLDLDLDPTLR